METTSTNKHAKRTPNWSAIIPIAASVMIWHGILLAAAKSGKGFVGNLSTLWDLLFFMLPLFNLLVCIVAVGQSIAKRNPGWSHAVLGGLTLLPIASLLVARRLL